MGIGTLTQTHRLAKEPTPDKTLDSRSEETLSPEERTQKQMMEHIFGPELFYRAANAYIADVAHFSSIYYGHLSGTSASDWGTPESKIPAVGFNVWDSPKLQKLLAEPLGSPIDLTMEEADELVRLAAGRRPDLPAGKEFVKEVRELLGHSLIERLKKAE